MPEGMRGLLLSVWKNEWCDHSVIRSSITTFYAQVMVTHSVYLIIRSKTNTKSLDVKENWMQVMVNMLKL